MSEERPAARQPGPGLRLAPPFTTYRRRETRQAAGARRVFHAALIDHLRRYGASSTHDLVASFGWFFLLFTQSEIEELTESAFRYGVVERLAPDLWTPTDQGRTLPVPRGASPIDLLYGILGAAKVSDSLRSIAQTWWPLALPALGAVGIGFIENQGLQEWLASSVITVTLLVIYFNGVRGEMALRNAAEAWPRFRRERTAWFACETRPAWQRVPMALMFVTLAVCAFFIVDIDIWPAAVFLAMLAVVLDAVSVYPLRKARDTEAIRVLGEMRGVRIKDWPLIRGIQLR
jgi:hypothetical protein